MAAKPVGEMKRLVSLVDRTDFDEFVYPKDGMRTVYQSDTKPYHNFVQDAFTLPFIGSPTWGSRITFSMPYPWPTDMLNWIALRLKPLSWLPPPLLQRLGPAVGDFELLDPNVFWIWAQSLGTIAVAKAEMEVNGVIVEEFSGDWLNVWNKTTNNLSRAVPFDDGIYNSYINPSVNNIFASEDGYIYCYLPFWFSKYPNTAFPLASCNGPDTIRFHITLRPFNEVVRMLRAPMLCDSPGKPTNFSFSVRDYSFPFRKFTTFDINIGIPEFESADLLIGGAHIDGPLREAYVHSPHEILMEPVVETYFAEPLKYVVNTPGADAIRVNLPLREANGPIKQILFFIRRSGVRQFNDWNNYSATLQNEYDPVWNPQRPLLVSAELQIGTALWAQGDEKWWRASSDIYMPGGIRAYGNYIYAYNFASRPDAFNPSGSANASRVDMKLNLNVVGGIPDDWTVTVFYVGTNWMRFQNGLANQLFMD
jgi:hypothetical protein